MSTRGFVAFVVDQTEKIAYNHWDSYPDGLGVDVLAWLRAVDLESVARQVRDLRVVDPGSTPTAADVERLAKWTDTDVGKQSTDDWYCLLRRTQGNPAAMLEAGVIENASQFPADSLFAEWGYVVDFDQGVFEVYRGFQEQPHDRGRFAHLAGEGGYQPVALVASWSLGDLPDVDRFLAAINTNGGA
jgi:hypothetical protein